VRVHQHPYRVGLAVLLASATLFAAACQGSTGAATTGDQPKASGTVGELLTIGQFAAPQTLDPAKTVQNYAWFEQLAYEPLIIRRSDGSLQPGLATSWRYAGSDNTTFELQLRPGVTFSDGSPLTAQAVVDHFAYVMKSGGQYVPLLAGDTFSATGPMTVTIKTPAPNPDLPTLLTQDNLIGGVISPAGLAAKDKLGTQTFGAGRYRVDPAQTVAGDHYTYVPNPRYYDQSAVYWKKVVFKIIPNPQSVLNAMRTGQVDLTQGDPSTLAAAKQAGITVTSTPLLWVGATLADRGGTMSKPLGDVRVRKALNLATDRRSIATALFAGNGEPTNQLTVPGGYGYDESLNSTYPYDAGKAKALLADAGYPDGFPLKIVTAQYISMNLVAQALAQQWKQIGVDLQITDYANANQYNSDAFGAKFPAFMTIFGQQPIWTEGPSLFLPKALFNPFHSADQRLQSLYDGAARATGADKDKADQAVQAYLVDQAWFVPVLTTGLTFYGGKKITGTTVSPKAPLVSLLEVRAAE
jgi:peptide/nickel transport system substrate-binding protein